MARQGRQNIFNSPRRERRQRQLLLGGAGLLVVGGALIYWQATRPPTQAAPPTTPAISYAADVASEPAPAPRELPPVATTNDEVLTPHGIADATPAVQPALSPPVAMAAEPETTPEPAAAPEKRVATMVIENEPAPSASEDTTDNPQIAAAERQMRAGKLIEARHALNALLSSGLPARDAEVVRGLMSEISSKTVLAARGPANDPLVDVYTVQSGDVLVRIGQRHDIPAEGIIRINEIKNPRGLRVGQKLRIPRGPFEARIDKSDFRLDLYLDGVYIRSYPVALGRSAGTPAGKWRVKERLLNPTFYPPASFPDKRVISGGDPRNPLGTHWIGLEGIEGAAVGQEGFGIHGTIEPDKIGQAVSLGCVRLRNEDVAFVYDLLMPGKSIVTTAP